MVDVSKRDMTTELFGRTYAMPVGIAPTGAAGLFRPGADLMLAAAAAKANVPFIMSGASTASIEDLAKVAPEHGWYQLYAALDKVISMDQIRRAEVAGLSTLVVTVDVPVHSNRERNKRNGWTRPLKLTMGDQARGTDAIPTGWPSYYANGGQPNFPNWAAYAGPNADAERVGEFVATQTAPPLDWNDIEKFREAWPRKLVLKGIMHPEDAIARRRPRHRRPDGLQPRRPPARPRAVAAGSVARHPRPRRRQDDLDARQRHPAWLGCPHRLCMGAKFCFVGRWTLYGVAAGGEPGAAHALGLMKNELSLDMGQMGAPDIPSLGPEFLMWDSPEDLQRNRRP